VTSSVAVFEAATWVIISVYDKIMTENQKKRKHGNQRHFYTNLNLIDDLGMQFTAC